MKADCDNACHVYIDVSAIEWQLKGYVPNHIAVHLLSSTITYLLFTLLLAHHYINQSCVNFNADTTQSGYGIYATWIVMTGRNY